MDDVIISGLTLMSGSGSKMSAESLFPNTANVYLSGLATVSVTGKVESFSNSLTVRTELSLSLYTSTHEGSGYSEEKTHVTDTSDPDTCIEAVSRTPDTPPPPPPVYVVTVYSTVKLDVKAWRLV